MTDIPLDASPYVGPLREVLGAAGDQAIARFRRVDLERKADGTDVTEADRAAEAALVEGLRHHFPDCGVVGEEGAHETGDAGIWHVDPIDGTSAYLQQLAHWGPTVCLVRDGRLEVGALWLPRLNEFWFAQRGRGAWRNGQRLRTGDVERLERRDALFVPSRFHQVAPFPWKGKVRALGSSAAHMAMAASGGGVAAIIGRWSLWDVGCGALLIEEAGRSLVGLDGEPIDLVSSPGLPFLAGAPTALRHLVSLVAPLRARLPKVP